MRLGLEYTYIHLCRKTLLAISDHGVSGQGNDRSRRNVVVALPLTNLCRSFESTLLFTLVLVTAC